MSSSDRLESDATPRAKADEAAASRAESLISAETRALEMIAGGARLADVLDTLCDTIDAPELAQDRRFDTNMHRGEHRGHRRHPGVGAGTGLCASDVASLAALGRFRTGIR